MHSWQEGNFLPLWLLVQSTYLLMILQSWHCRHYDNTNIS